MGFDPDAIALIREAFRAGPRPLSEGSASLPVTCRVNDVDHDERELQPVAGRPFVPPRGWRGHLG
jgi:hypothetical protein